MNVLWRIVSIAAHDNRIIPHSVLIWIINNNNSIKKFVYIYQNCFFILLRALSRAYLCVLIVNQSLNKCPAIKALLKGTSTVRGHNQHMPRRLIVPDL